MMNRADIMTNSIKLRTALKINNQFLSISLLASIVPNLTLVFFPMGERISGICIKNTKTPLIALNSSMSKGRQLFSFAHELFHLYYDNTNVSSVSISHNDNTNEIEKAADQFASLFLMPEDMLTTQIEMLGTKKLTIEHIVKLEQTFNVSRQAILNRLLAGKYIKDREKNDFSINVIQSAVRLGYSDELYRPNPVDNQYSTYGEYIKITTKLLENDKISNGLYEELLLNAYRSDLVYGVEEESLDV